MTFASKQKLLEEEWENLKLSYINCRNVIRRKKKGKIQKIQEKASKNYTTDKTEVPDFLGL
jgi:hypothetical protein